MITATRRMLEAQGRLRQRTWREEVDFGGALGMVRYRDTGAKGKGLPWYRYDLEILSPQGATLSASGAYVADPKPRLASRVELGEGVEAVPKSRGSEALAQGFGLQFSVKRSGAFGSRVLHDGHEVARFGLGYGDFEVDANVASEPPVLHLLATVVACGLYRIVQRGAHLDRALLHVASPFRQRP